VADGALEVAKAGADSRYGSASARAEGRALVATTVSAHHRHPLCGADVGLHRQLSAP